MSQDKLKQALNEAFLLGQRYGCSYGMGELQPVQKLKYETLVLFWCAFLEGL